VFRQVSDGLSEHHPLPGRRQPVQSVGADGRPLDSLAYPTSCFVMKPSVVGIT
jgi:hypothetical protein